MPGLTCMSGGLPPYARAEVGGRRCRQPGQVRKEAATTISCRVVGFHRMSCRVQPGSTKSQRMPASLRLKGDRTDGADLLPAGTLDCFAALAMTAKAVTTADDERRRIARIGSRPAGASSACRRGFTLSCARPQV